MCREMNQRQQSWITTRENGGGGRGRNYTKVGAKVRLGLGPNKAIVGQKLVAPRPKTFLSQPDADRSGCKQCAQKPKDQGEPGGEENQGRGGSRAFLNHFFNCQLPLKSHCNALSCKTSAVGQFVSLDPFSYFDIRGIPSPAELGQSSKAREVKGRAAQPWPRNSIDPRAFHRRHKNK